MTALMGIASRIRTAKLQLILDTRSQQKDFRDLVVAAVRGGVDVVEVRDPHASTDELLACLEVARAATAQLGGTVVVGRDRTAARRLPADVLHLGASDDPVATVRAELTEHTLVGRSAHDASQLQGSGADYLLVGPVFGEQPLPGLALVRKAARQQPVHDADATPWFAVGGIDHQNLEQVLQAGAVRVAVSGAITGASDPQAAAEQLRRRLQQAWDARPEMEDYALKAVGGGGPALRFNTPPVTP